MTFAGVNRRENHDDNLYGKNEGKSSQQRISNQDRTKGGFREGVGEEKERYHTNVRDGEREDDILIEEQGEKPKESEMKANKEEQEEDKDEEDGDRESEDSLQIPVKTPSKRLPPKTPSLDLSLVHPIKSDTRAMRAEEKFLKRQQRRSSSSSFSTPNPMNTNHHTHGNNHTNHQSFSHSTSIHGKGGSEGGMMMGLKGSVSHGSLPLAAPRGKPRRERKDGSTTAGGGKDTKERMRGKRKRKARGKERERESDEESEFYHSEVEEQERSSRRGYSEGEDRDEGWEEGERSRGRGNDSRRGGKTGLPPVASTRKKAKKGKKGKPHKNPISKHRSKKKQRKKTKPSLSGTDVQAALNYRRKQDRRFLGKGMDVGNVEMMEGRERGGREETSAIDDIMEALSESRPSMMALIDKQTKASVKQHIKVCCFWGLSPHFVEYKRSFYSTLSHVHSTQNSKHPTPAYLTHFSQITHNNLSHPSHSHHTTYATHEDYHLTHTPHHF